MKVYVLLLRKLDEGSEVGTLGVNLNVQASRSLCARQVTSRMAYTRVYDA